MSPVTRYSGKNTKARWKPKGFEGYLTRGELCAKVERHRSRILQLERAGKIPAPVRVNIGKLSIRLYSPQDVARIVKHFTAK